MTRLQRLQASLHNETCVVENPIDLFYLTGLRLSTGKLCVHAANAVLFVDGRYIQAAQEIPSLKACLDEREAVRAFFRTHPSDKVYFDGGKTPYTSFLAWQELLKDTKTELIPNKGLFQSLRVIKDSREIAQMKKSAQLLWKGFLFILSELKEGITEREIAKKFEVFCLQNGADGLAFEPIIAFGAHSAMPHYHPQEVPLKARQIVLIDIGVCLDQYRSDMTRVVFYKHADPELERLYRINKKAQEAALALCRPGVSLGKLDRAARDVMAQNGVEQLYLHSLGHGIGLETHEFPRIKWDGVDKDVLMEPGMVFTVEPGLYVPGKGGVRYEDTIVITSSGYENFYPDAGDQLILI